MERKFDIGDRVICLQSGVVGKVFGFYTPTACAEQTKVLTDDERIYHAPTNEWIKYDAIYYVGPTFNSICGKLNTVVNTNIEMPKDFNRLVRYEILKELRKQEKVKAVMLGCD
jgi:hypothetical protein